MRQAGPDLIPRGSAHRRSEYEHVMSVEFKCAVCGAGIRAAEESAGSTGKCPRCGELLRIPGRASVGAGPTQQIPEVPLEKRTDHAETSSEQKRGSSQNRRLPAYARCVRCGYDLRGQAAASLCPECGTPVSASYTPERTSALGTASLVLGIVSIPTFCLLYAIPSLVCGILAVVFGGIADRQIAHGQASAGGVGIAKAGRICGWIGIALGIAFWALLFAGCALFLL